MSQLSSLFLADPDATAALARRFAAVVGPGDVLLLQGPIGAGKSHFARALIQSFVAEDVPSPTFTLVQTYEAPDFAIWHADLYRLGSADEVAELGLFEAFDTAVCLVEWPEKLGEEAPKQALTLRFSVESQGRHVQASSLDGAWDARVRQVFDGQ